MDLAALTIAARGARASGPRLQKHHLRLGKLFEDPVGDARAGNATAYNYIVSRFWKRCRTAMVSNGTFRKLPVARGGIPRREVSRWRNEHDGA